MDVGKRIKEARRAKGLTQVGLEKLSGVTQPVISRLEKGEYQGNLDNLSRIARALDMTITELLGMSPEEAVRLMSREEQARKIAEDAAAHPGLRAFAADLNIVKALRVTADEWDMLRSIKLPEHVGRDGYVTLLIALRGIIR